MSQVNQINNLWSRYTSEDAKEMFTPMCSTSFLILEDPSEPVNLTPYCKLTQGLQYMSITKPDVSSGVNQLAQFMHIPQETTSWSAIQRVLLISEIQFIMGYLFVNIVPESCLLSLISVGDETKIHVSL